jgi:hypothetical protein
MEERRRNNETYLDVYLGDLRFNNTNETGEVKVTASNWTVPPEYREFTNFDFDVGLLFLDTAVPLGSQIQIIQLPPSPTYRIGNSSVDVTYGWGRNIFVNYTGICTHCLHTNIFTLKLRPQILTDWTIMGASKRNT